MKEEDLKKNLDKIIIDGLIKEAEQENADFEAAIKKMSNEDFLNLIMNHEYAKEEVKEEVYDEIVEVSSEEIVFPPNEMSIKVLEKANFNLSEDFDLAPHGIHLDKPQRKRVAPISENQTTQGSKRTPFKKFVPWLISALAAAACILAIVLPTVHHADAKLCEGALMMSRQYLTVSKGGLDITNASEEEIKNMLPMLERNYRECIIKDGKFVIYTPELQECGWDLTLAYLKLHKKGKAVDVLRVLSEQYQGTPFGNHCEYLLKQLD